MKSVVSSLVENVKIPRMFQVRQIFPEDRIEADQIPGVPSQLLFVHAVREGERCEVGTNGD